MPEWHPPFATSLQREAREMRFIGFIEWMLPIGD